MVVGRAAGSGSARIRCWKMPQNSKDALWIILAGIASSLGAVAILTGLGGLLIAARLEAADLPTEIAVAAIPKPVLLTLGAEAALPLVLTSALVGGVVAATHALAQRGLSRPWHVVLLVGVVGISIRVALALAHRDNWWAVAAVALSGAATAAGVSIVAGQPPVQHLGPHSGAPPPTTPTRMTPSGHGSSGCRPPSRSPWRPRAWPMSCA
jgi:hypothetical protein